MADTLGSVEGDEEITRINVTPLVDIFLVLLIIFLVTANFIVRETMEVDLPRAANGGETVQGLLNVVLDKTGKLYLDGEVVDSIDPDAADELMRSGTLAGGIIPKLAAAVAAARSGVPAAIGRTEVPVA